MAHLKKKKQTLCFLVYRWFDRFILVCILINSFFLAAVTPMTPENSDIAVTSDVMFFVFVSLFFFDLLISYACHCVKM